MTRPPLTAALAVPLALPAAAAPPPGNPARPGLCAAAVGPPRQARLDPLARAVAAPSRTRSYSGDRRP